MKTFGEYLKIKRSDKELTLTELASQLNLDLALLAKIENDLRNFPKSKLFELSKSLQTSYEELESHYIFNDIQDRYSDISDYKTKIVGILNSEPNTLESIIASGENNTIEFKSSLRYCLKTKKSEKYVEFSAIKNIAAFLNSNGGKLIIGVEDSGKVIGLNNTDFKTFKEKNKVDGLLKYLDNLISKFFGNDYSNYISTQIIDQEETILLIDVLRNKIKPTFISNPLKDNKEEFYIRRSASSVPLSMEEFFRYSIERWSNNEGPILTAI